MPLATDNSRFNTEPGRLRSLRVRDGGFQIALSTDQVPAFLLEANALVRSGQADEARRLLMDLRVVEERVAQDPSRTDLMYVTARLLMDTGLTGPAEVWLKRVVETEPHAQVFLDLAHLASAAGRYHEAVVQSSRAVDLEPESGPAAMAHGKGLVAIGQVQQGLAQLERAIRLAPTDPLAIPTWLWTLHYLPGRTPEWFSQRYRAWAREFVPPRECTRSLDNDPDPERRIRVGYLSPHFHAHAVARAFEPFLLAPDREGVELYGYGIVVSPDRTTDRLQQHFDWYRPVYGMSPEQIADLIRMDRIDILVAVSGHVSGNGLGVLADKPAPIQVDYGGIDTSGMAQIDYRLTDSILDPPDTQPHYTERLVYLPGGLASYVPPPESPCVTPLPARANGFVTFGSFNNNAKFNPMMMDLWAEILRSCPASRFLIKCHTGNDPAVREHLGQEMEDRGVNRGRIEIHGMLRYNEYLRLCSRVDLALDVYPYNGCLTTLEGLWMGVPIVSLSGEIYVSRVSSSILSRLGLEVFVATTPREYVAKAIAFASQWDALEQIRRTLRQRVLASPLCDPGRLGQDLSAAYRWMWRQWCDSRKSGVRSQESE